MSDEVEQITKKPEAVKSAPKEKDPKKVAAGKKLAEYNKRAKEALAREIKRDADQSSEETSTEETISTKGSDWMPELSLSTVLSLVGIGLTIYTMYRNSKKDPAPVNSLKQQESNIPELQSVEVPKMGML